MITQEEIIKLETQLKNKPFLTNKKEIQNNLLNLLKNIINSKDKKIGIAFSGGVDSTFLAYLCHKLKKKFKLYSVGLENSKDLEHAEKIAFYYKWPVKFKILNLKEAEETIKGVVDILPDPSVVKVGVACPEYHVLKMAKEDKVNTIMTGLGSEEIFAGYERHKLAEDIHKECWNGLKQIHERDISRDLALADHFNIKLFCPFLDKEIINYSMQISPDLKINNNTNKYILRETTILAGLKEEFALRPKKAAQYGSGFDKAIDKLARKSSFKYKQDYLNFLKGKLF